MDKSIFTGVTLLQILFCLSSDISFMTHLQILSIFLICDTWNFKIIIFHPLSAIRKGIIHDKKLRENKKNHCRKCDYEPIQTVKRA